MRFVLALVLVALMACAPDPAIAISECRADGVDYCAELLAWCALELDGFEQRRCRTIVAADDWCACRDAFVLTEALP
jgi:hypothetical protein